MKHIVIVLASMLVHLLLANCSNLRVGKNEPIPGPDKLLYVCNNTEYFSDTLYMRAAGLGTSRNESTANRMAALDANVNLARAIEAYLEKIAAFKAKRQVKEGVPAVEWEDDQLSKDAINMKLGNVAIVCTETTYNGEMYSTIMVVEIPLTDVLKEN